MISSAGRRALYTWERRGKKIGWSVIRAVFILGFAFVILYSPIGMLARAFMSPQDLYDSSVLWLPKHFTFTNIEIAARAMHYGRAFWNSFWTSTLSTLLQLFCFIAAGFAFARY